MADAMIRCEGVWKIFGAGADNALRAVRERGATKQEVLRDHGAVIGVADVSFEVKRGEIFCIMGLSGSGKSTLVRHLNRLVEPTDGKITIAGKDVGSLKAPELRSLRAQNVGMVFQNMALLPHRTVRDNVALSLELRGVDPQKRYAVAMEKLRLVSLEGWEHRYPDELSGGMKQRVGLARAMAADPEILLMDEPFSALDPLIRRQLQDQFLDLAKVVKKTTVFITHDLDEAIRLGDQIAIMKDGRFVQVGTPEEIVTNPADEYVADFVKGISRVELVTARRVMEPLDGTLPLVPAAHDIPSVAPGDPLSKVIEAAAETDGPVIVADGSTPIGMITKKRLLLSIRG